MYERFEIDRVLVIAPKRVALDTWTTESAKWDHLKRLKVSRVLGSRTQRMKALDENADIYVINRENVEWLVNLYGTSWPFDMIVIDELSSFKNNSAKRFKALRKVRPRSCRVVGLTGTPSPNGLLDLWPQIYLLDMGERLGKTMTGYRHRYFYPESQNGYVVYKYGLKPGADAAIQKQISDIAISMKADDYLSMPEMIVNDVEVRLDPKEMRLYKEMEKVQILEIADEEITALSAAAVYNKLLQLANGSVYANAGDAVEVHNEKIDALQEILDEAQGQSVMVFYDFRHDLAKLMREFKGYGPRTIETQQDIRDWNDGKIPLLLAQPASMGHGLNLQAGGHIIVWYGLTWSLELYQQANARLYRQGQQHPVIIHRLIAKGTIDEDVIKRLATKDKMQESLMQSVKAKINEVKEEKEGLR